MFGYDDEAIYQDADIEQWEWEEAAAAIERGRAAGICQHQGVVGAPRGEYEGKIFYPEQEGLVGEQLACTDGCGRVFEDNDAWFDAMREARM